MQRCCSKPEASFECGPAYDDGESHCEILAVEKRSEFYYTWFIVPPRKHLQPQGLNKRMEKVPRAGTTMAGKVCIHIRIYFGSFPVFLSKDATTACKSCRRSCPCLSSCRQRAQPPQFGPRSHAASNSTTPSL